MKETLRFVLLEHRRDGVHYDLMLETEPGGALRTWAIDEKIVTGKALPARPLADHRAVYLDYEGEVSGGRGSVRRLDRGEYVRLVWTDDHVRVRLAGRQLVGAVDLCKGAERVRGDEPAEPIWTFRLGNFD